MRRWFDILVLLSILFVVACSFGPQGSPTVSATRNGFQVDLWLSSDSVRVGDHLQAFVRVTNNGSNAPMWETNTCLSGPAPITAEVIGALPPGIEWEGLAGEYKKQVLEESSAKVDGLTTVGYFEAPRRFFFPEPSCSLISKPRPFHSGQVEQADLAWDVVAPQGRTIPTGELIVRAVFSAADVEAVATISVEGSGVPPRPTIVDYVDAALAVPEFREWLETQPKATWVNTGVGFWPNEEAGTMPARPPYNTAPNGVVDVGLFTSPPGTNGFGQVMLDPLTLEVLGTRFE